MLTQLEAEQIIRTKSELKPYYNRVVPGVDFTMFPGGQFGGSVEEIRALIKKQKRAVGVAFVTVVGRLTVQIPVPGNARMLLGYRILSQFIEARDRVTLQINNEVVIQNVQAVQHNIFMVNGLVEYIPIPRPLSGQDQILLFYDGFTALTANAEIFFL